jgi:putative transposase
VNGRKRHLAVDTLGLVLAVAVHEADIQDYDGAWLVFAKLWQRFPRLAKLWADSRYERLVETTQRVFGWALEIVKRSPKAKGFELLPHRWIGERTFAWLGRSRRLSKEYEERPESSEAMIYVSMIHLMVRRLRPT